MIGLPQGKSFIVGKVKLARISLSGSTISICIAKSELSNVTAKLSLHFFKVFVRSTYKSITYMHGCIGLHFFLLLRRLTSWRCCVPLAVIDSCDLSMFTFETKLSTHLLPPAAEDMILWTQQKRFVLRKSGRDAFSVVNSFRRKHLNIFLTFFNLSTYFYFCLPSLGSVSFLKIPFFLLDVFYLVFTTFTHVCTLYSASRWTNMSLPCSLLCFSLGNRKKIFCLFLKWISFSKNVANYFFSRLRKGDFKKK